MYMYTWLINIQCAILSNYNNLDIAYNSRTPCTHTTHPTQHMTDIVPTSPLTSPLYTAHITRVQLLTKFFPVLNLKMTNEKCRNM